MSETVIQIEGLSKRYRLGVIGGKRLVDDVSRQWAKLRGKPDPLSRVDLTPQTGTNGKNGFSSEEIWALKDVSLEVKQGEVLGIIGKNGAGKSTLLKILSRVTAPSDGEVRVKGRIASLLEVGTGFHPELTGRENVFLNGAILGMTKDEIRRRFDEIVEFSEIGKFIDTPVKRYSSGMYVRLAFAVAAHLDPEIMIVDEVLAVGDVGFQKKCLGKMDTEAKSGRTILFVSHNMAAVRSLCTRCILIDEGTVRQSGDPFEVIERYSESCRESLSTIESVISGDPERGEDLTLNFEENPRHVRALCGSDVDLEFVVKSPRDIKDVNVGLSLLNGDGVPVMTMSSRVQAIKTDPTSDRSWRVRIALGRIPLNAGTYRGRVYIGSAGFDIARFSDAVVLEMLENDVFGWGNSLPSAKHWGATYWAPEWEIRPEK